MTGVSTPPRRLGQYLFPKPGELRVDIVILLAIVAVFFFLVLRPARQRQKQFQNVQSSLEPGKRVMLSSGIHGTLVDVAEQTVDLEISPGTVVTVARQAVAQVFTPVVEEHEETDERGDESA